MGGPAQLHTVDPGFPGEKKSAGDDIDDDTGDDTRDADEGAPATPGYVLLRDGDVVARFRQVGDHKVSITADPPEGGKFTTNSRALAGPRVLMRSNMVNTEVRQVTFREGREVVHFDPPPGSGAEARLASIAASPWKRVLYPVGAGVGKSGSAIAMIVLSPLIARLLNPVLDWISERMPDIDIPWPDISLPSIPWPDIALPSINLPEVNVPGWIEFLVEYSKVWVPLLIGVALAVIAVRHSRKSRRIKKAWETERRQTERGQAGRGEDECREGECTDGEAADDE